MNFCDFMYSVGLCFVKFDYKFSLIVGVGIPPFKAECDFRPNPTAIIESEDSVTG